MSIQRIGRVIMCAGLLAGSVSASAQDFTELAIEAEDFTIEKGWEVVRWGHGNYMVDIIGFNHVSGERLLGAGSDSKDASAYKDVNIPAAGNYRFYVRYEYPPFTEARFEFVVSHGKKILGRKVMGQMDQPRLAFNDRAEKPQYDPPWGPEGLVLEYIDIDGVPDGSVRLQLRTVEQPQVQGVSAARFIDFVFITTDRDYPNMFKRFAGSNLYPIMDAFRAALAPRWEVQISNHGSAPGNYSTTGFVFNRVPWSGRGHGLVNGLGAGETSGWVPLTSLADSRFSMVTFSGNQPWTLRLRAPGTNKVLSEFQNIQPGPFRLYVPPYAHWGEVPVRPETQLQQAIDLMKNTPAVGKVPTKPLVHGGWIGIANKDEYGRKNAELFATMGMRSFASGGMDNPQIYENLKPFGVEMSRSLCLLKYRFFPTDANIAEAKKHFTGREAYQRYFDYGDEIPFNEWFSAFGGNKKADFHAWLDRNRPGWKPADYWFKAWGDTPERDKVQALNSRDAAAENPLLFIASTLFYEDRSIELVAAGAANVRKELGDHVMTGANYACHPFYYPSTAMYIKWFRGNAADVARHSEYFWQVGQAGPMVNGYIIEHFRAGLRKNPRGIIRQYTMPHMPGNTVASFLRTGFSHLAHGAKELDFFGIGMNEGFTENHVDHRYPEMYLAMRDLTHSLGMVEDEWMQSGVLGNGVAMLISHFSEIWDYAPIARDYGGHDFFNQEIYRNMRLANHIERIGLYKALTFAGVSPDLVVEADLGESFMNDYRVLYISGDHLPAEMVAPLQKWVERGGIVMAVSGSGRFDIHKEANPAMRKLLGVAGGELDEKDRFYRPVQELPFLKAYGTVKGDGWDMPVIARVERIQPVEGAEVIARFEDDAPAVIGRALGKGHIYYVAAFPGTAYFRDGVRPAQVPNRSPSMHVVPSGFQEGARLLIEMPLEKAGIQPLVTSDGGELDYRLIKAKSFYALPVANYNVLPLVSSNHELKDLADVTFKARISEKVRKVRSAYRGEIPFRQADGVVEFTVPGLGYGDLIRLDI